MSNTATTSGGKEVAHDITQLIRLLESLDTKVSEDATQALRQQLAHGMFNRKYYYNRIRIRETRSSKEKSHSYPCFSFVCV
jgi:hypothetical protein